MIKLSSGTELNLSSRESTLIPPTDEIVHLRWKEEPGYILVVEKEAIFQTLCHSAFADNRFSEKKRCHYHRSSEPFTVYSFWNDTTPQGKGQPDIATRGLVHLLGQELPLRIPILLLVDADVYGLELHRFHIDPDSLLHISNMDYRKALHMLSRLGDRFPSDWKDELTRLVLMRRKAEIEILSQASRFFSTMALPAPLRNLARRRDCGDPPDNLPDSFAATTGCLWDTARSGPALIPYLL
ncbi:uncharacterized protein EI90DRAFT_3102889, partial [Cantharellus anzutake]|uniref:uncharacterized protein n=1 Tax=Cantharellus anzutake TaxID=1750568 RepID=UPI0019068306